ncbi:hypothetical protein BDQ17DRAFT_1347622 [Cyathus striatus]|nr:hypothetical protein BDQ17DRAFT_1347622 [Cyathus striatus]
MAKLLVFEAVVDGGFGRTLKLEEGAVLELGRWEYVAGRAASPAAAETSGSSGDGSRPNTGINNSNGNTNQHRRRFTHFHFRKRSQNRSVSGPALAVVDAEPQEAAPTNKKEGAGESKEEALEGIRVTIRLAALDEQGSELASPNEQITYLHVVRFGPKPVVAEGEEPVEDTRPWVVKVVKREATVRPYLLSLLSIPNFKQIGPHTALPAAPHTYPPDASSPTVQPATPPEDDDPQSECLLCLSEPREVVLLPCRHLVACKDCAVNMPVEPAPAADTPTDGDANANSQGEGGSWFCPVCRQPYTSLLRITTSPPPPSTSKDEGRSSGEEEVEGGNGLLGGMLRPGFLRGLSLRAGAAPPDVESTAGLGRQGA